MGPGIDLEGHGLKFGSSSEAAAKTLGVVRDLVIAHDIFYVRANTGTQSTPTEVQNFCQKRKMTVFPGMPPVFHGSLCGMPVCPATPRATIESFALPALCSLPLSTQRPP